MTVKDQTSEKSHLDDVIVFQYKEWKSYMVPTLYTYIVIHAVYLA